MFELEESVVLVDNKLLSVPEDFGEFIGALLLSLFSILFFFFFVDTNLQIIYFMLNSL